MPADYDNLYSRLNEAQKEAVDAIDGPVMVIAGPGTGKTQILAARILNILKLTDARPEEILCLTYTENGAQNMRQRLTSFMGPEAYKVNIHTFHGLCNKIIRDNPEKFAKRELRLMEDIERVDILNEIIRELPAGAALKSYQEDPGVLRNQLAQVYGLVQEEGYTVAQIKDWVLHLKNEENFKAAFPDLVYRRKFREFKAGDIKKSEYDKYTSGWTKLIEAAGSFDAYRSKKEKLGVFEYRDMIQWVCDGFASDSDLLLSCQEQYQYVLVDEYQDTSGLQNQILLHLISFWEDSPNCFVVGDDDQSIYAFQGARVANMTAFADRYKQHLKTILLTSNYRSPQSLLDSARKLIENNVNRLVNHGAGLSKDLEASGENARIPESVKVLSFRNRFAEAVAVADSIQAKQAEGSPWKQTAVIYSKHRLAEDITEVLRSRSIPFVLAKEVDVFQEPLILELYRWLQYLSEELEFPHKGEHLLYEILHSPLYDISPFEIAKISSDIYNKGTENNPVHWRNHIAELLKSQQQATLFGPAPSGALRLLWEQVESWLKQASMLNVPQLIESIYSGGGFLGYALKHVEREWCLEVMSTFMQFAVSRNQRTPFMSLRQFLREVETMISNGIALPLEKRIGSEDGVVLTSAHGAKGLEYDYVYIISAERDSWEKDRSSGLPFKVSALIQGMSLSRSNEQNAEEGFEERRRLFYVAMTRARKGLTISYSNQKMDAKESRLAPSQFVVEITGGAEIQEEQVSSNILAEVQEKILQKSGVPHLQNTNTAWIQKQISGFKFSPTTLYNLFECGLKFYFLRLVRFPSAPSAAMAYGEAMHKTLAALVSKGTNRDNPNWWEEKELIDAFENELYHRRSAFTEESYRVRLQQGRDLLPTYYASRKDIFKKEKVVITEKWFQTSISGVEIGGFTDKLVFNGNDVTIVDYKSGNPLNAEKKFRAPKEKQITEGKLPEPYWFQLGIYHLVVNGISGKNWRAAMGILDLLDKNEKGEFAQLKVTYSPEELDLLTEYITEGKRKLDNMEFLTGCNHCEWCEFAKQTGQVVWIPGTPESDVDNTVDGL